MHSSKNPKAATLPHSFTKSNVRKIGEILRTQDQPSPAYTQAITDLDVWRAAHMHPMRICYEQAIRDANRISQEIIVTQRLKRLESILGKLTRFPAMNLAKMRDVGGVRIICPDIKTLVRFQKYYLRHDKKQDVIDYILNPRPSGYRGIHLVRSFRLTSSNQQIDALAVEIQLRTFLQHLWATAVETVDAFRGTTMKFGNSDRGWEEFFALVANAFAIIENQPKISQYAKYSLANTLSTINQVDQQRHILSYIEVCAKTNYIKI